MNEELIKDKLETHEKRINNHADRLDKIELNQAQDRAEIKNLCKDIRNLTSVLKGICGLLGGALVTFFFYAIQNHLFR